VAHEYFNADWLPMPFSDVANLLSEAKLSFAASANFFDHSDGINLTADQQTLLGGIKHPVLKESVRDYMVNQQFRRDIWVKGARPMLPLNQSALIKTQGFALLAPAADVPLKIKGMLGETKLQPDVFQPIIELLAKNDFTPKTGAELAEALPKLKFAQIVQALVLLAGTGHVSPTQAPAQIKQAQATSDGLNAKLIANAEFSGDTSHLASPVVGGAVSVSRFQQLFLKSIKAGRKTPAEWAADAWKPLLAQGQRLIKDGKTIEKVEDNIAELKTIAEDFNANRLSIMKALRVG
jgi:hypothetical protein